MEAGITRNVHFQLNAAVVIVFVNGIDRDRLSQLLCLDPNLFEALLVTGSLGCRVTHFRLIPATNGYRSVEGGNTHARRSANGKALCFLTRELVPVTVNGPALNHHAGCRTNLFPLSHLQFTLSLFDFTLRLAHCNVDLPLSFALRLACFSGETRAVDPLERDLGTCHFHLAREIFFRLRSGSYVAGNRSCGAERAAVLRVSDADRAVDIAQLDAWATGADLAVETVSDVFAVLDLHTEVIADRTVNRAGAN